MKRISVVTTLYQSEEYIQEFFERTKSSLSLVTNDYEIVMVNDGSKDNSLHLAKEIRAADNRVKVIDLSRNYGHHQAIMAGLEHADGEYVWLIDCDLEEEPEWIVDFYREVRKSNEIDVLYGVQRKRKGDFLEVVLGKWSYDLLDIMLPFKYPRDAVTARIMTDRYVRSLLRYKESSAPIFGLMTLAGYVQKHRTVDKGSHSPSTYTFIGKLRMLGRTVASFSSWPLFMVFYIGLLCVAIGTLGIVVIVIQALAYGSLPGWTSLIASVWLLGGLNLVAIGIVGIYLQKVYIQTKRRPSYIVKDIY